MPRLVRHPVAWLWPAVLLLGIIVYRANQDGSCRRRTESGPGAAGAPDRRVRPRSNVDPTPQAYADWLLRRAHAWAGVTRQAELAAALEATRLAFRGTDCGRTMAAARDLRRRLGAVTAWPRIPRRPGDPPFPGSTAEMIREVDAQTRWLCPDYRPF